VHALYTCLKGDDLARRWVSDRLITEPPMLWGEVKSRFTKQYQQVDYRVALTRQYLAIKQHAKEDVKAYAARFNELSVQLQHAMGDERVIEHLLDTLLAEYKVKIMERQSVMEDINGVVHVFKTVEEVFTWCLRIEYQSRQLAAVAAGGTTTSEGKLSVADTAASGSTAQGGRAVTGRVAGIVSTSTGGSGTGATGIGKVLLSKAGNPVKCYTCGGNHFQDQCTVTRPVTAANGNGATGSSNGGGVVNGVGGAPGGVNTTANPFTSTNRIPPHLRTVANGFPAASARDERVRTAMAILAEAEEDYLRERDRLEPYTSEGEHYKESPPRDSHMMMVSSVNNNRNYDLYDRSRAMIDRVCNSIMYAEGEAIDMKQVEATGWIRPRRKVTAVIDPWNAAYVNGGEGQVLKCFIDSGCGTTMMNKRTADRLKLAYNNSEGKYGKVVVANGDTTPHLGEVVVKEIVFMFDQSDYNLLPKQLRNATLEVMDMGNNAFDIIVGVDLIDILFGRNAVTAYSGFDRECSTNTHVSFVNAVNGTTGGEFTLPVFHDEPITACSTAKMINSSTTCTVNNLGEEVPAVVAVVPAVVAVAPAVVPAVADGLAACVCRQPNVKKCSAKKHYMCAYRMW
jgi:hypothetical protein